MIIGSVFFLLFVISFMVIMGVGLYDILEVSDIN